MLQNELAAQLELLASRDRRPAGLAPDGTGLPALGYSQGALVWDYQSAGDYDQNGEVNSADLIPLAKLLGTSGPFDSASLESVVDGDGNGVINIADVTAIAQAFGRQLCAYSVLASPGLADYPNGNPADGTATQSLGSVAVQVGSGPGRLQFLFPAELQQGWHYWVRAMYSDGSRTVSSPFTDASWRMPGGGPGHQGNSPACGPLGPHLHWSYPVEFPYSGSLVATDGNIYYVENNGDILALDPQGQLRWKREFFGSSNASPALASDGSILVSGQLLPGWVNGLHAFGPDGELRWTAELMEGAGSPVISAQGSILLPASGYMLSVDNSGTLQWSYSDEGQLFQALTVDEQGNSYFAAQLNYPPLAGSRLYALDSAGSLRWTRPVAGNIFAAPVISPDGRILVLSSLGRLYSFTQDGVLSWSRQLADYAWDAPALDNAGRIYLGLPDGRLMALDADGNELWEVNCPSTPAVSPVLDAAGRIYMSCADGSLLAYNADGSQAWLKISAGQYAGRLALTPDGGLLCAADELRLYGSALPVENLVASDGAFHDRVQLHWDAAADCIGYELQLRPLLPANGDWQALAQIDNAESTQYTHLRDAVTGPPCLYDTPYSYRIRALDAPGNGGAWSSSDSGYSYRQAVMGLRALRPGYVDRVRLDWQAVVGATAYRLQYREADELEPADWMDLATTEDAADTSFNHTAQTPAGRECAYATLYEYRAAALFDDGQSEDWSAVVRGQRQDNWTMYGHDATHSGRSLASGPATDRLAWDFEARQPILGSAVCGSDGSIYFGCYNRKLYALHPDGSLNWTFTTGYPVSAAPCVAPDGTIYVGSDRLYALDSEGRLLWTNDDVYNIYYPFVLDQAGNIIVGGGQLHEIDPDGVELWQVAATVSSAPALDDNGGIYLASGNSLLALDGQGSERWQYDAGVELEASPAITADGGILCPGSGNTLLLINPDGSLRWQFAASGRIIGGTAQGTGGQIYFGTASGSLQALNLQGSLLWTAELEGPFVSMPALDAAGRIYIGSNGGNLYALQPDGEVLWTYAGTDLLSASPCIGPLGQLYIGGYDGLLHAFAD